MRRPLAAIAAFAFMSLASARARADEALPPCSAGLILGVSPDEGAAIVDAVCANATKSGAKETLRVAVIRTSGRPLAVVVTRTDLVSGEERVEHVDAPRPKSTPPAPAPAPAPPRPSPTPAAPTPEPVGAKEESRPKEPTIAVEVDAPGHDLELSREGQGGWEIACRGSCTVDLPLSASYRFVDKDGKVAHAFRLKNDGTGSTKLRFVPRSVARDAFGVGAIVAGSIALLAGLAKEGEGPGYALIALAGIGGGAGLLGTNHASVDQNPWRGRGEGGRREAIRGRTISATLIDLRF